MAKQTRRIGNYDKKFLKRFKWGLWAMGLVPLVALTVVSIITLWVEPSARIALAFYKVSDALSGATLFFTYISFLTVGISAYWAIDAYSKVKYQNFLGARHEFQRMLLEMNKVSINDPYLAAVNYTRDLPAQMAFKGPGAAGKRKQLSIKLAQFNYLRINIFEAAVLHFCDNFESLFEMRKAIQEVLAKKDVADQCTDWSPEENDYLLDAWVLYYAEVLEKCYQTVSILQRESSNQVYATRFLCVTDEIVKLVIERNKSVKVASGRGSTMPISALNRTWVTTKTNNNVDDANGERWENFQILKAQIVWRKAYDTTFLRTNDRFDISKLVAREKLRK